MATKHLIDPQFKDEAAGTKKTLCGIVGYRTGASDEIDSKNGGKGWTVGERIRLTADYSTCACLACKDQFIVRRKAALKQAGEDLKAMEKALRTEKKARKE